jgi:hypothetical protein
VLLICKYIFDYKEGSGIRQQRGERKGREAHKPKPSEPGGRLQQLHRPPSVPFSRRGSFFSTNSASQPRVLPSKITHTYVFALNKSNIYLCFAGLYIFSIIEQVGIKPQFRMDAVSSNNCRPWPVRGG